MACDRHTWDREDPERYTCVACDDLKYDRTKYKKPIDMANQSYKLIDKPTLVIDDKTYIAETCNMNLEQFLNQNAGKEIYILKETITTNQIRAIVI